MYIIIVEATKKTPSGIASTGGDSFVLHSKEVNEMEYQINVYETLDVDRDYSQLNRDRLFDELVPVPGAVRQIPESYFRDE